jgi:hypothetical protein
MKAYRAFALGLALLIGVAYHHLATRPGLPQSIQSPSETAQPNPAQVERGRYLVKITGCNDCHTPGYAQTAGGIPEQHWLTGDRLGFRGPWGTTYPTNLRLYMQYFSEEQWIQLAQTAQTRPPMPWFVLHAMTAADLSAIYHFIRFLGPAGDSAPAYLPPGQEPKHPYVQFPGIP